jgi:hypothetical protein
MLATTPKPTHWINGFNKGFFILTLIFLCVPSLYIAYSTPSLWGFWFMMLFTTLVQFLLMVYEKWFIPIILVNYRKTTLIKFFSLLSVLKSIILTACSIPFIQLGGLGAAVFIGVPIIFIYIILFIVVLSKNKK